MTNLEAVKSLYEAEGGNPADVADMTVASDVIYALAVKKGLNDITVAAETGTTEIFGKKVSTLQTGVSVSGGKITGTLKFVSGGFGETGPLAGDGNFLALKFTDSNSADSIKVGLRPSAGTGLVELVGDPDQNGVFKVAGELDGVQQVFVVRTTKGSLVKEQVFDISELVLQTS